MRIGSVESVDEKHVSAIELDSHADSPVEGRFAKVLEDTGRKVQVSGFTSELAKPVSVPTVHPVVAYDCEYTGKTHILVIHNALYLRTMSVNLIPPFMMRLAGLEVNECPKFLSKVPSETQHSVSNRRMEHSANDRQQRDGNSSYNGKIAWNPGVISKN